MAAAVKFVCLLLSVYLAVNVNAVEGGVFENYVRRNIPSGHTMTSFVETCEGCGALFGKGYTYKCLTDKSLETFKGCYIGLNNRLIDE